MDVAAHAVDETVSLAIHGVKYEMTGETTKTVHISGEEQAIVTVELTNYKKGQLIIRKLDSESGKPLAGATFLITDGAGTAIGSNNGLYITDANGLISIAESITPGTTIVARETKAPTGYILDETPQQILIKSNTTHTLTFSNRPDGGLVIRKLDEDTGKPIEGVTFEISHMNGERIGSYRTDKNGYIRLTLESDWYSCVETKAGKGYKLDSTPTNFEVKDGKITRLEITNQKQSSILIHKVDSVTGKGIPGVVFLLYDNQNNPIGQYTSDQEGYVWIDRELDPGKYLIREMAQASGYILDPNPKTIYIEAGRTTEVTWKNTPIMGQLQIVKVSASDNPQNGIPANSLLPGAVYEVKDRAGNVVDIIKTGNDGCAVTKQLPIGRYYLRELTSPAFYQLDTQTYEVEIEFAGQIVRREFKNESVTLGVSVTKKGYNEAVPGQLIRYDFSGIANTSNVPLQNFYFRDTLPTEAVELNRIVTGTFNQPLTYKILYRTNTSTDYKVLADNLSTQTVYALDASPAALRLAANEYVTEVYFLFGEVRGGFAQVEAPRIYCQVLNTIQHETRFVNQADVGGLYNGKWIMHTSRWVTVIYSNQTLPRTGY